MEIFGSLSTHFSQARALHARAFCQQDANTPGRALVSEGGQAHPAPVLERLALSIPFLLC